MKKLMLFAALFSLLFVLIISTYELFDRVNKLSWLPAAALSPVASFAVRHNNPSSPLDDMGDVPPSLKTKKRAAKPKNLRRAKRQVSNVLPEDNAPHKKQVAEPMLREKPLSLQASESFKTRWLPVAEDSLVYFARQVPENRCSPERNCVPQGKEGVLLTGIVFKQQAFKGQISPGSYPANTPILYLH